MSAPKLLIVEDDSGLQSQLRWCFDEYEVIFAEDRGSAMAQLRRFEPAVVLHDLGLPPDPSGTSEGMASVADILSIAPATKIIVITGNGDEDSALKAVEMGAYDFYQKPLDTDVLKLIVQRAFHIHNLEAQNRRLQAANKSTPNGLIASSQSMLKICRLVEKVASTSASVLLLGETGTGKEVLARALHDQSDRSQQKFIAINCAAIPENLLESELFGFEKGAYTGAHRQTRGKVELAHEGTLFLDEIGDMPPTLQSKLLRFLQERIIERVGGREEIPVDVRVICATHQDLSQLMANGTFREDLYYRVSEVVIAIPPLRERAGDVALLAKELLRRSAAQHNRPVSGFTEDALTAIQNHRWPGNVREMENRINSAVIMADAKLVTADDLQLESVSPAPLDFNLRRVRDSAERSAIERVLSLSEKNITRASELLGVSRPTFYDLLKKHGLNGSESQT